MKVTFPIRKRLLTGTLPVNNSLLTGTVPVNNFLLTGTFSFNFLYECEQFTGTVLNSKLNQLFLAAMSSSRSDDVTHSVCSSVRHAFSTLKHLKQNLMFNVLVQQKRMLLRRLLKRLKKMFMMMIQRQNLRMGNRMRKQNSKLKRKIQ